MTSKFHSVIERAIQNYTSGKYGWCKAARFRKDAGWATNDENLAKETDISGSIRLAMRELSIFAEYNEILRKFYRICNTIWKRDPVGINDGCDSVEEVIEYMTQVMENEYLLDVLDVMES